MNQAEEHLKVYCPELKLWSSKPVCRTLLSRPHLQEGQALIPGVDHLLEPVMPLACESCPHRPKHKRGRPKKADSLKRLEGSRWLERWGRRIRLPENLKKQVI